MAQETKGVFDQQIEDLEKKHAQEKKAIEDKKQLCEIIKTDVIKELEKKYDHKEFDEQFDKLLILLEDYFKTGSGSSKKSILKIIPVIRDLNKW